MRLLLVVTGAALLVLVPARGAWAYVDPSAGSIMLQVLLGGAAGIVVALKLGGERLWSWLRRRQRPAETARAPGEPRR